LPLEGEVRRRDDERAGHESSGLVLFEKASGHDGAGSGVIGQEEAVSRELEAVVIDRFELVGERVSPGDGREK
jgi:hypothetical protein